VLLAEDGTPRLADFGLARLAGAGDVTKTGEILGTIDYLSPEACKGQPVDARSDIWALGVLISEMLAGEKPFRGESQAATLHAILTQPAPDLAELCAALGREAPPALADLVGRMLEKDWAERIASMRLVGAELEAIQASRPITTSRTGVPSGPLPDCPYRGLFAFREEDAPFFFGREAFAQRLVSAAQGGRLVAVVGPSGSGKSSVVFAGLLPRLRQAGRWTIVTFRPGSEPLRRLASALLPLLEPDLTETERLVETRKLAEALGYEEVPLADVVSRIVEVQPGADRMLLLADQFEEVYTQSRDPERRRAFLDAVLAALGGQGQPAARSLTLVLTIRADFWEQALAYRPLADALQNADLILGPMNRDELERAVAGPAEELGVVFEAGLVERILDDVGDEPGNLPLLEFALTKLWDHEKAWQLSHKGYEAIGRVEGALTLHAEDVYAGLATDERAAARRVFTQLVRPGGGTEDTRRLARIGEIGEEDWGAVRRLADARLVVTGRDADGEETAELTHEALIGGWERLRGWMAEDRTFRAWQERLRAAQRAWETGGHDEGPLLRGAPLAEAEGWLAERPSGLRPAELAFVEASVALRDQKAAERERQQQRELALERRGRRLMAIVAAVLGVAVVITLVLTGYSLLQRRQATEAYSLSLAASAQKSLDSKDSAAALKLALEANQIRNPPLEAQRVLMDAAYTPGARWGAKLNSLFSGANGPATALAVSPDGETALLGLAHGAIIWFDLGSRQELGRLVGHTGPVNAIAFAPDGSRVLSGGYDGRVLLWDVASSSMVREFGAEGSGHAGPVRTVDIDAQGGMALSGGLAATNYYDPGDLILWNLETGEQLGRLEGHEAGIVAALFTPDGSGVLASSGDARLLSDLGAGTAADAGGTLYGLRLWDVASGQAQKTFELGDLDVYAMAISPDGSRALTGSYFTNNLILWDLESGQQLKTLTGHSHGVTAVTFTPGRQQAVSGSFDQRLIVWDLEGGSPLNVLKVHRAEVLDLGIVPGGEGVLSAAGDGMLVLSDLVDGAQIQRFEGHGDWVYDVALVPGTDTFVSVSGSGLGAGLLDGSIRLWDLESGAELRSADLGMEFGTAFQVAVSPDGSTALVGAVEPVIRVWDLEAWELVGTLEGHGEEVTGIAYAPDGEHALSCSLDGTMIWWDVPGRRIIRRMQGPGEDFWSVTLSPDGKTAVTDSRDSALTVWDPETGQRIRDFAREEDPGVIGGSGAAFLPGTDTVLAARDDGALIEWDLESGKAIRWVGQHPGLRARLIVSPDGRLAMSSTMDGSLMLWDLERGELIRRTEGHGVIFDLTLGPDGTTALFGSSDWTITEWRFEAPDLEALKAWVSENRYLPGLTCEEREAYGIGPLCGR
jgi:WD40 repeat protein